MIPEEGVASEDPDIVERVVFCSGKVYYDLIKQRATKGLDETVAIVRVEQVTNCAADPGSPIGGSGCFRVPKLFPKSATQNV